MKVEKNVFDVELSRIAIVLMLWSSALENEISACFASSFILREYCPDCLNGAPGFTTMSAQLALYGCLLS